MTNKWVAVTSYVLQAGYKSTTSFDGVMIAMQGYLECSTADGGKLIVYGLHPSSPVPAAPSYNPAIDVGAIFVPFADLPTYVDLVRNEKPVYAHLNSESLDWMCLTTSPEPVGEAEARRQL